MEEFLIKKFPIIFNAKIIDQWIIKKLQIANSFKSSINNDK